MQNTVLRHFPTLKGGVSMLVRGSWFQVLHFLPLNRTRMPPILEVQYSLRFQLPMLWPFPSVLYPYYDTTVNILLICVLMDYTLDLTSLSLDQTLITVGHYMTLMGLVLPHKYNIYYPGPQKSQDVFLSFVWRIF